jgi:hypothetical protein
MWQRLSSHYAAVAILGLLALATPFHNGLLTDVDLQTEDDISASQARLKLLPYYFNIFETNSTVLHQEQLLQKPHTPFSLSTFSSADDMFVSEHLTAITAEHPKDLVVVFVDTTRLETLGVWLDHYKQHDNSGRILCIFAVSKMAYNKASQVLSSPATQDKLGNVGETLLINLHPGKDMKNLHNLGVARLQMMRRIINTFPNLNVLYTDTDAIWLKDPAQLYHHPQHQSSNIVASRGTYPQHCPIAGEANGDLATIWFGFTYFRNSPDLRQLVLNVEDDIGKYQYDDQHAINCVLSNLYNSNNLVSMYYEFHTSVITLEDGSLVRSFRNNGVVHNIKASLLPYHQVQRHCDDMTKVTSLRRKLVDSRVDGGRKVAETLEDVVVAYCYAEEKEGNSKMASFERYGFLMEGENSLRHPFS